MAAPDHQARRASAPTARQRIAADLRRRHLLEARSQQEAAERREVQQQRTRSLVRVMQLDTRDRRKIEQHAENARHYNDRAAVLEQLRVLELQYQASKKTLAAIADKRERHERVLQAKATRDKRMVALRQKLEALEATAPAVVRPGSSSQSSRTRHRARTPAEHASLPNIGVGTGRMPSRGTSRPGTSTSSTFKELMEQVRKVKQSRNLLLDPYMANLKLARLWERLNDTARSLENYDAACQTMTAAELERISPEMLDDVLEKQRLRRREALHFLFSRAIQRKHRQEAADFIVQYLALSLPEERQHTLDYLERLLREQEYIEDPTLSTPDDITFAIRSTNSLGHLTDLRFQLLQEMLAAAPSDPYLLESVANLHVRRGEFAAAEALTAQFVKLPVVRRISLFATFSELRCGI